MYAKTNCVQQPISGPKKVAIVDWWSLFTFMCFGILTFLYLLLCFSPNKFSFIIPITNILNFFKHTLATIKWDLSFQISNNTSKKG